MSDNAATHPMGHRTLVAYDRDGYDLHYAHWGVVEVVAVAVVGDQRPVSHGVGGRVIGHKPAQALRRPRELFRTTRAAGGRAGERDSQHRARPSSVSVLWSPDFGRVEDAVTLSARPAPAVRSG